MCSGSWAACGPVWSSSTRRQTAAWETTTWFTSTSKRRSASPSSSRSSPHTSSSSPTSTSPHVSPALAPSSHFSPRFNIWKIQTLSHACWVRRSVFVCQGCRDNPHTGTLYTAVRTHSPNPLGDSPVQILIHGTNAHMLRVNKYLHSTFTFVMCKNNLKNNLKIDFKCSFTACFLLFLGHKVYFILDF